MYWKVPRIWEDGRCFIIGGGPSLTKVFGIPADLVEKVRNKEQDLSAYSPYLSPIHKEHVIGVNMAYALGPWVDVIFYGDDNFWARERTGLLQFKGLRVSCCRKPDWRNRKVKHVERQVGKKLGITELPSRVVWNFNSGAAAMNFAFHTGVKEIILLGFDMKLDNGHQHWHKEYSTSPRMVGGTMKQHLKGFPVIAEELKGKVTVLNISPESAITAFPVVELKDVL